MSSKTLLCFVSMLLVGSAFFPRLLRASEPDPAAWPRFRGPNGSGLAPDDIPALWSEANHLWKLKLPGGGHGSPAVWGNRIFLLCGNPSGQRIGICVQAATGKILWQMIFDATPHKHHRFNSFASTTPAIDADHVYFSWGTPRKISVAALTHDGKPVWEADLGPALRGEHGFACSPIVHEDLVILSNDQEREGALLALDRKSGQVKWKLPREENHSNYSTPCIFSPAGGPAQIVVSSWRLGVSGVEAATGKNLWQADVFSKTRSERAIGSPIVTGDLVIANCAFVNGPKHVVALRPGQDGAMEEIWRVENSVPHIPTVIVVKDRAFLWSDQGIVTCVNLSDGQVIWQERVPGDYFGSPVCANGKLFAVDKQGTVTVIAAADKLELLARNEFGELCHTTPAVAGGRMFVRTWEHLHAIGSAR